MLSALIATIIMMPQPVITRGEWLTDFEKAKRYAQATNRPMVLNFTGSDWCPYCLRLKKEVFSTDMFLDWAHDNAILVEVDFPRKKVLPKVLVEQNERLALEYSVGGYPSILFLNADGELLGRSGYLESPGPSYWIQHAESHMEAGRERLANSNGFPEVARKALPMRDFRGQKMPSWELGECVSGSMPEFKGKTVLIDFWATWCGPCVGEMPKLERWSKELGDDFVVVGITDEPEDKVKRFASRNGITYPLLSNSDRTIQKTFELNTLPAMVLVSSDGVVRWQGTIGDGDPLTTAKIKRMMEATR